MQWKYVKWSQGLVASSQSTLFQYYYVAETEVYAECTRLPLTHTA